MKNRKSKELFFVFSLSKYAIVRNFCPTVGRRIYAKAEIEGNVV